MELKVDATRNAVLVITGALAFLVLYLVVTRVLTLQAKRGNCGCNKQIIQDKRKDNIINQPVVKQKRKYTKRKKPKKNV